MDSITNAIITALSAGVISGLTDTAKATINDSYNKLKGLFPKKFGADSDVVQAIGKLEAKPDSQGRQETLAEEIVAAKAEQDEEILAAAKHVLTLVQSQQAKFMIQNSGSVYGQVAESHAPITMNFGELPKDG